MQKKLRNEARFRAAFLFGIVAALGVGLFHYRFDSSFDADPAVLIPYISVVIGAAFFGAAFSGWYFRETGIFELVIAPLLVILCAALLAGQLYALHNFLWASPPPASFADSLAGGIYASVVYLYASSPIVVPMAAIASYMLWRRYRLMG
jgi:hypothetical protein